jgi:EAL domain-containing protein (putative c-di-GMP-specific phosphodiesterase class I)
VVALASGEIAQWELLLRVHQREGQLIPPAAFLPTAERFGLMEQVDRWVVRQAIDLLARHDPEGNVRRLEVNVAARSISDMGFTRLVEERLAATGIDPGRLILEISEASVIADLEAAGFFAERLKRLGCRFALDNFGTGFGSLLHIRHLPLDYLKIDGSFTRHLAEPGPDQHLVEAITGLAQRLGYETIAGFVGDEQTVGLLRRYSVDYVQGYHIGMPRLVEDLA